MIGEKILIITSIEKTKKGRYSLFIDGEFLFSVHPDTYLKSKLKDGQQVSIEELEEIRLADEYLSAKENALNILSRTSQSSGVLADKLSRYYGEEAVERTVTRMNELGLLNDLDYALRYSRDCVNLKKYSLTRTKQDLKRKKIPPHLIEEALAQFEEDDEPDQIVALILKKYKSKIMDHDGLQKTIAALMRRGFPYRSIKIALDKIEEEELYLS